jgi:hypothetical protein
VFLYSLVFFSDTDLLCKDLVLCGLIWQGVIFIFYIVNFVIFDIKSYGSSKQAQSNKTGDEVGSDNSTKKEERLLNVNMGILLNILACEIVLFASICTVWIIALVECGRDNQSILCYSTWGKHPVNIGIGTATLLVSVSVFFSTLVVYKQNIDHHSFIMKYVEIFLTCYSILITVMIKSKLGQYTRDCIANFEIVWTSNIPEYLFFFILMFSHFAIAIFFYLKNRPSTSETDTSDKKIHLYTDIPMVTQLSIVSRVVATFICVLNLINLFQVSTFLNVVHTLVVGAQASVALYRFVCPIASQKIKDQ